MSKNERLQLAIPNGELRNDVTKFMQDIGLQFDMPMRSYILSVTNFPLDLLIIRASDIPKIIYDERSTVKVGITGSDLIWEAGLSNSLGEELPVSKLNPDAKHWSLYVGVSATFKTTIKESHKRDVAIADLSDTIVATEYPRVAGQYFDQKGVQKVTIYPVGGTHEVMPYAFPDCNSVLGVLSSGNTSQANNIDVLDVFHEGTIRMLESTEKLSRRERDILNDVREKIAVTLNKRL